MKSSARIRFAPLACLVILSLVAAACSSRSDLPSTSAMETEFAERRGPTFTPVTTPTVRPVLTTAANSVPSPLDVIVVVDGAANRGRFAALVLDAAGNPVISYYDSFNDELKLARCRNANCTSVALSTVASNGRVGQYTSLVLDARGNPVISYFYFDSTSNSVRLAHCNDPYCASVVLNTVDSEGQVGEHTSLVLDAAGNPIISYYSFTERALKLAACHDPNCASATLSTLDNEGNAGQFNSLVLDAAGNPVISYLAAANLDLKLARCSQPDCATGSVSIQTVESKSVGRFSSLALDAAGIPIISYYNDFTDDLHLARCHDPNCVNSTITVIDSEGETGWYGSLVLDAAGNPVISYYDRTNLSLKLAQCHDPNCATADIAIVDDDGDVGWYSSLALDCAGNPVIAYYDFANQSLKVASVSGERNC
ncbi:MAG: hypothetical protein KIS85_04900 [Anaerolineales bacterium]|nr:hypothetical protein [Anaerolineales bacterium]